MTARNPFDGVGVVDSVPERKYLPSAKQLSLIIKLRDEKDTTGLEIPSDLDTLTGGWEGTASALIDALFKAPYKTAEPGTATNLNGLVSGYYGVAGKRYKVDVVESGKWEGWLFFKTGSEYHDQSKLGSISPGGSYRGAAEDVLEAIIADPLAAAQEYARITGRCGICNRTLEDPASVARGIGPVCAENTSW